MPEQVIVLVTNAPDQACAEDMARELVEQGLAACVNVGAPMLSVYRWHGAVESAHEIPMWIKSTAVRQEALIQAITRLHPYEVPEILVLPIDRGLPAYLDWVREETQR
jgi:periplasmic divalent cation tolerance protein